MTDGTRKERRAEWTALAECSSAAAMPFQHEHERAASGADVDGFVARVQYEDGLLQSAVGRHSLLRVSRVDLLWPGSAGKRNPLPRVSKRMRTRSPSSRW